MTKELKNKILNNSISLDSLCIFSFAYKKEKALELIEVFRKNNIAILGGDVLFYNKNRYKFYGTDNWYINKNISILESGNRQSYIEKSCDVAKKYIENYKEIEIETVYTFTTSIPSYEWKENFYDLFPTIKSLNNFEIK